MSIAKGPLDGGQGGRLGHSNMDHWDHTEEVKAAARKRRRFKARADIVEGLIEHANEEDELGRQDLADGLS